MSEQAIRVESYAARNRKVACYWKAADGWCLYFPAREGDDEFEGSLLANLANHTVEEHSDGTISATPSIKVWDDRITRHGYLTRGVWTEC